MVFVYVWDSMSLYSLVCPWTPSNQVLGLQASIKTHARDSSVDVYIPRVSPPHGNSASVFKCCDFRLTTPCPVWLSMYSGVNSVMLFQLPYFSFSSKPFDNCLNLPSEALSLGTAWLQFCLLGSESNRALIPFPPGHNSRPALHESLSQKNDKQMRLRGGDGSVVFALHRHQRKREKGRKEEEKRKEEGNVSILESWASELQTDTACLLNCRSARELQALLNAIWHFAEAAGSVQEELPQFSKLRREHNNFIVPLVYLLMGTSFSLGPLQTPVSRQRRKFHLER